MKDDNMLSVTFFGVFLSGTLIDSLVLEEKQVSTY